MATKKTAKKSSNGQSKAVIAAEIGAGVAAVGAAAAAGYYFYGDKKAKKHRQAASKWAKGMKTQVIKEAKKVEKMDKKVIAAIVDNAAAAYQGVRSVDAEDVRRAAAELKQNWEMIQAEAVAAGRAAKKSVKKATKKAPVKKAAPKKAAKKSTKKG